jgi:hypothetical protein
MANSLQDKELANSHRKNRRYAYLIHAKNYDKRIERLCLRVLRGREVMRRKFYLHKRRGVFYACLVNQETGLPMSARSTGERDRDAALIVVSGWLRDGLPGKDGERRKAEAAFDLDGIRKSDNLTDADCIKKLVDTSFIDQNSIYTNAGNNHSKNL